MKAVLCFLTRYALWLFPLLPAAPIQAQPNIPLGEWRLHVSYNNISHIAVTSHKIFAAAGNGVLVYDRIERSVSTYDKLNGLSSTGISAMAFDHVNNQLLVGYENGLLDIISETGVRNFQRLRNAEVTTSMAINHISVYDNLAYLSTAYGVVIFDLRQLEIKETWRDLGVAGDPLRIFKSLILNDSIFLASADGVMAGSLEDNLLDFNNWIRFNTGALSGPVPEIAAFNGHVYAAGATGLFRLNGSTWEQEPHLRTAAIRALTASSENLFIIADDAVWFLNSMGMLTGINNPLITAPAVVKQDDTGNLWIGDQLAGLLSDTGGSFASFLPDGPSLILAHEMVYNQNKVYVLPGGFSASGQPRHNAGNVNIFEHGRWSVNTLPQSDLTGIIFQDNRQYIASFGSGIRVKDAAGDASFFDGTNSPLGYADDPTQSRITSMALSSEGLWVASYDGIAPLHLLRGDNTWESFSFSYPNAQHPTALAVDGRGDVWMALNPETGGGLIAYDTEARREYYKTTASGNGALPDEAVYAIATDRDGTVWVGTGAGAAYFHTAAADAVKPVYENRFLLRDERITAIAVDPGNRKWIGTRNGVWLFGPTGETPIHHFTDVNSPLLSNVIRDITIHPITGEVFFATTRGIVSFRSDATHAAQTFDKVRIFPNPVTPHYSGTVGIDGLARDAQVRITDISGKLVWQTQANGGMASWNVRNHNGQRVATGVYLVFVTSADGSESVVGKIAVVE